MIRIQLNRSLYFQYIFDRCFEVIAARHSDAHGFACIQLVRVKRMRARLHGYIIHFKRSAFICFFFCLIRPIFLILFVMENVTHCLWSEKNHLYSLAVSTYLSRNSRKQVCICLNPEKRQLVKAVIFSASQSMQRKR